MLHGEKKIAKIVEEMTMFFFTLGGNKMNSGIEKDGNKVKITFRSNYSPDYEYGIERLEQYLNEPRNEGMEDIYWELAGSGNPGESSQLLLVRMMIDRYEIQKYENEVELHLYKELLE